MAQLIDLTGQKFGKLTVLERDLSRTNGTYWKCQCDCGKIISTRKDTLTRTKSNKTSCGCDTAMRNGAAHIKDETGKRYGKLTVIERAPDLQPGVARWRCLCDCGKETEVNGAHLRNGNVQSCGCKKYESHNGIDETGKRYGKLLVLERSQEKNDKTHIFWKCQCDCGNTCVINGTYLRAGVSTNCGCERSVGEAKIAKILQEHGILYKREYTFPDLLGFGGGRLRFDFGILNENKELLYLIEFDGVQHFESTCFGASEEDFDILQKYDKLKNEYCQQHNIPLIRLNYKHLKNLKLQDLLLKEGDE